MEAIYTTNLKDSTLLTLTGQASTSALRSPVTYFLISLALVMSAALTSGSYVRSPRASLDT